MPDNRQPSGRIAFTTSNGSFVAVVGPVHTRWGVRPVELYRLNPEGIEMFLGYAWPAKIANLSGAFKTDGAVAIKTLDRAGLLPDDRRVPPLKSSEDQKIRERVRKALPGNVTTVMLYDAVQPARRWDEAQERKLESGTLMLLRRDDGMWLARYKHEVGTSSSGRYYKGPLQAAREAMRHHTAAAVTASYNVGFSWESVDGNREIIAIQDGRAVVQTGAQRIGQQIIPIDELEKEIAFDTKQLASRRRSQDAAEKERAREEAERQRRENTYGFTDNMSPPRRAKALQALLRTVKFSDGIMPIKQKIERLHRAGWTTREHPKFQRIAEHRGTLLTQRDLTKTGLDYLDYLNTKKPRVTANRTEKPMDRETEQQIIKTLWTAGHERLAKQFAIAQGYRVKSAAMPKVRVYDNGGETADRYTVVPQGPDYRERNGDQMMLGLSSNPTSPQGVSQWSSGQEGPHLGKKIPFNKLPPEIQKHVLRRLSE
jgi:hypothetical protein